MKQKAIVVDAGLNAFRELTASPSDGTATRARVLEHARRRAGRRAAFRRLVAPFVVLALSLSAAAGAWTATGRWRAPAPRTLEVAGGPAPQQHGASTGFRPRRVVPAAVAPSPADGAPEETGDSAEARLYARAHRAHFVEDSPGRALAAWDAYLAAAPHGTFAPEARYNRALCLIRLGRFAAARRALRPFAEAPSDGYRREEAALLLDWLARRE